MILSLELVPAHRCEAGSIVKDSRVAAWLLQVQMVMHLQGACILSAEYLKAPSDKTYPDSPKAYWQFQEFVHLLLSLAH